MINSNNQQEKIKDNHIFSKLADKHVKTVFLRNSRNYGEKAELFLKVSVQNQTKTETDKCNLHESSSLPSVYIYTHQCSPSLLCTLGISSYDTSSTTGILSKQLLRFNTELHVKVNQSPNKKIRFPSNSTVDIDRMLTIPQSN